MSPPSNPRVVAGLSTRSVALRIGLGLAVTLTASCSTDQAVPQSGGDSLRSSSPPNIAPPPPTRTLPTPGTPVPQTIDGLAHELGALNNPLYGAVETWLGGGAELDDRAAFVVQQGARRFQEIYRFLARRPGLASAVAKRLPAAFASRVRDHVRANRRLMRLITPLEELPGWKLARPAPPAQLRGFFERAEQRFRIPWETLAAVNLVESRFGRILGPSSAGARGPMQFLPSTWAVYGRGDIDDPRDSIMAAARYLAASGGRDDMRAALFAYNRSFDYVDAIQTYSRYMKRDERNYYVYYFWEVFVLTTEGDVQLTGPGGARPYPT